MKRTLFVIITALILCAGLTGGAQALVTAAVDGRSEGALDSRSQYSKATGTNGRATDVELMSETITATRRFGENYTLSLSGSGSRYRFPSNGGFFATGAGLSFGYNGGTSGWGASYSRQNVSGEVPARDAYSIYYLIQMLPNTDVNLSYGRENRINNIDAVKSNLGDKYLSASLSYAVNPLLSFACDFKKADVSDGNKYQVQGLQSKVIFSKTPSFYALFRLERQMYDTVSSRYYSPADHVSFSGTLAYKREVRVKGLKGLNYELALKATGDSNSDLSFHPQAAVNVDINKHISAGVSYSQTVAPDNKDSNVSVSLTWHP